MYYNSLDANYHTGSARYDADYAKNTAQKIVNCAKYCALFVVKTSQNTYYNTWHG
jgi:hypothetical protein